MLMTLKQIIVYYVLNDLENIDVHCKEEISNDFMELLYIEKICKINGLLNVLDTIFN